MTSVAWITHRALFNIPGERGGAEMADEAMIERRPQGVDVHIIRPGGVWNDLRFYDKVVVSGLGGFNQGEIDYIAATKPIVWVHDSDTLNHPLHREVSHLICLTPDHLKREAEKLVLRPDQLHVNPGWMDTSELYPEEKTSIAVWPHRDIYHKGWDRAIEWSTRNKVRILKLTNVSRQKVLSRMRQAQYFILLSHIFDAGPRSVIEAQLCGCQLVIDNVGYFREDADTLRERINQADKDFWGLVCES